MTQEEIIMRRRTSAIGGRAHYYPGDLPGRGVRLRIYVIPAPTTLLIGIACSMVLKRKTPWVP